MRVRRVRAAMVAAFAALTLLTSALAPAGASAGTTAGGCRAGAPGVGDPYFPLYGNGGYDVKHYLLRVSYDPATDRLVGVATISARATESLCRFNLDFQGMTVRSVKVNGKPAQWSRSQFIALAERISGQQLDDLFDTWLFTPGRPALGPAAAATAAATAGRTPPVAASLLDRMSKGTLHLRR